MLLVLLLVVSGCLKVSIGTRELAARLAAARRVRLLSQPYIVIIATLCW